MPASSLSLTFHGAAQTVTGSLHVVEANGARIALDCGLAQGRRKEAFEQNRHPAVDPAHVDAIILSHAHLDHSGNLPTWHRLGFKGSIFCTPATADLAEAILMDSAMLQVRQVELVNRQRRRQGKNLFEPLYEPEDAEAVVRRFAPVPYGRRFDLPDGLKATFNDAGHILGSATTLIEAGRNGAARRIFFSGDLGRSQVILRDPTPVPEPDYVITESTYGDRKHPPAGEVEEKLERLIAEIQRKRSRLIIPSFAIERSQAVIYHLHQLFLAGRIPAVPIYLDSPLALRATEVFIRHRECYDEETNRFLINGSQPFGFRVLHYVQTVAESKALNERPGPIVIIAGSGMCEGGRVLHHLMRSIENPDDVVLLTGFQGENTLGRKLQDGMERVSILGESYERKCRVETMLALSGHADADETVAYYRACRANPIRAFLVHGEPQATLAMKARLQADLGWKQVDAPSPGERFELT